MSVNRCAVGLAVSLLALLVPERADACGPPQCVPKGEVMLRPDGTLPANVPGIVLKYSGDIDPALKLFQSDGGEVGGLSVKHPLGSGNRVARFFQPAAALTPSEQYRLQFGSGCSWGVDAGTRYEQAFTVGAAAPLPASPGTFVHAGSTVGQTDTWTAAGSCTAPLLAVTATFAFAPAAELVPYLPSTDVKLLIDGALWGHDMFNVVNADGTLKPDFFSFYGIHRSNSVFAACGPGTHFSQDLGLAAGPHAAVLETQIANGPVLRSQEIAFTLDCPPSDGGLDGGSTRDGGADGGTASDAGTEPDSGIGDGGVIAPSPASGCGCAQTGTEGLWALALSAVQLLRGRRRSRAGLGG